MGCLLWGFWGKLTALWQHSTVHWLHIGLTHWPLGNEAVVLNAKGPHWEQVLILVHAILMAWCHYLHQWNSMKLQTNLPGTNKLMPPPLARYQVLLGCFDLSIILSAGLILWLCQSMRDGVTLQLRLSLRIHKKIPVTQGWSNVHFSDWFPMILHKKKCFQLV